MAKTYRDVILPVQPADAYALVRASGSQMPSFTLKGEDPTNLRISFYRGFGWSNPIDVDVTMWGADPQHTTIRYEASILALADPFGFMKGNLDRFEKHLQAHHQAWLSNAAPPPPPKDTHSIKVNVAIIGCVVVFLVLAVLAAVILVLVS